ncbi:MAG: hypothetical protein PHP52_07895 [Bacteroidales bacterium]|nr:hypothetical protein [Bacteroidales bacterium]MDD4218301.1 hypothetical protein [Bacteroidales bacterium]MDY0142559.1 hypothetical protein [Bacteroidales bacterium]
MTQKDEIIETVETKKESPKKENKFIKFILKHKYYVGLILIIFIILVWSLIRIAILKNNFNNQKQEITTRYELKLDSLNSERLLLTATTFSWAIRSELLRDNNDQINQFFNEFVKNTDIVKLQFINPITSVVEISTDKKDEGKIITSYKNITEQIIKKDSTEFIIVTPITGLNRKIGIFVIHFKNLTY